MYYALCMLPSGWVLVYCESSHIPSNESAVLDFGRVSAPTLAHLVLVVEHQAPDAHAVGGVGGEGAGLGREPVRQHHVASLGMVELKALQQQIRSVRSYHRSARSHTQTQSTLSAFQGSDSQALTKIIGDRVRAGLWPGTAPA